MLEEVITTTTRKPRVRFRKLHHDTVILRLGTCCHISGEQALGLGVGHHLGAAGANYYSCPSANYCKGALHLVWDQTLLSFAANHAYAGLVYVWDKERLCFSTG